MACLSESGVSCWRLRGVSLGQLRRPLYSQNFPPYSRNRSAKGFQHFIFVFDTMELALENSVTGLFVLKSLSHCHCKVSLQCCLRFCIYALPNHSAGASHYHQSTNLHLKPHQTIYTFQTYKLNQFEMPVNDPESPVNHGPMSQADKAWYRIVRRIAAIPEVQTQDYVQQAVQREANGEAPILPTPEESELLTADLSYNTRWTIQTCIVLFEEIRASEEFETTMLASDSRDLDDEEGSGIQFSPSQVEEFLQTLSRVEISTLGTDNKKCSICKQEYGTTRGDSTKLASDSNQGLPGEEVPEHPVKLSCTHVFGEWCIKTWLLGQPASCPVCRFQFEPVR